MSGVIINSTAVKTLILKLQQALNSASIRSELQTVGDEGLREAKQSVPVRTGRLKNSIYSEVRGSDTVALGAREDYAIYVEMGTRKKSAKPFIEPAAQRAFISLQTNLERKIKGRSGRS